jgi:hypothetical protein
MRCLKRGDFCVVSRRIVELQVVTSLLPRDLARKLALDQFYWRNADWLARKQLRQISSNDVRSRHLTNLQFSTSSLFIPSLTALMASRRLALNLTKGLRSRAALNAVAPLRRGFATPVVKNGVKTESTTLSNGLTVGNAIRWLAALTDV